MIQLWIALLALGAPVEGAGGFDHQHGLWTTLLQKHVVLDQAISRIDYRKLKTEPTFEEYLSTLESVSQRQFDSFSPKQQLAFLINAYNAFTVKLILDNYPLDSIKDLGGFFSSPWKSEFFSLLGEKRHLDHIEHQMIRGRFDEPRIHFAVNCASLGCPALAREAYTPTALDEQLEQATERFLSDSRRNRYDPDSNTLELSSIFDWYGSDFEKAGSLEAFVASRITAKPELREQIKKRSPRIRYLDYDWSLNDTSR